MKTESGERSNGREKKLVSREGMRCIGKNIGKEIVGGEND